MTLTQSYHFCVRKDLPSNLICLIILISHIAQFLLIFKFCCFRQGPHISFKYAWHNHLRCPVVGVVSLKHSVIKHTCSWRDKLIVLWTLNRQAKIFSRIFYCMYPRKKICHFENFCFPSTGAVNIHVFCFTAAFWSVHLGLVTIFKLSLRTPWQNKDLFL